MNCPKCGIGMQPQSYEGVPLDLCPDCQGYWLDRGELREICDRREKQYTEEERDRFFDELHEKQGKRKDFAKLEPEYTCPRCDVRMGRLEYAYSSTVVIDSCPSCDGIFLDHMELDKLQIWSEERDAYREHIPEKSVSTLGSFFGDFLSALFSPRHSGRW